MVKLGIIGNQSVNQNFLQELGKSDQITISGIYLSETKHVPVELELFSPLELLQISDAILVMTNKGIGGDVIKQIIRNSKHLFFKCIPDFGYTEMKEIINLEKEAGIVTHLFNPLKGFFSSEGSTNEPPHSRLINLRTCFSGKFNTHASEILHLMVASGLELQSSYKRTDAFALKSSQENLTFQLRNEYENGSICNMTITSSPSPTILEVFDSENEKKIELSGSLFAEDTDSAKLSASIGNFIRRIDGETNEKGSFEDIFLGKRFLTEALDRMKMNDTSFLTKKD